MKLEFSRCIWLHEPILHFFFQVFVFQMHPNMFWLVSANCSQLWSKKIILGRKWRKSQKKCSKSSVFRYPNLRHRFSTGIHRTWAITECRNIGTCLPINNGSSVGSSVGSSYYLKWRINAKDMIYWKFIIVFTTPPFQICAIDLGSVFILFN